MKKLNYKPILLFLLSCFLVCPVFAISSAPVVMILSMTGLIFVNYSMTVVIYLEYIFIIDYVFYGSSKKQNTYISSLEKNRKYTVLQDAKLFLKQECVIVILSYAVYAIGAFVADEYIPATENWILTICQSWYVVPIIPSKMLFLSNLSEYLICVVCFSVLYCLIILWRRARIRKSGIELLDNENGVDFSTPFCVANQNEGMLYIGKVAVI